MKKLFKWFLRIFIGLAALVVIILALAYLNRDRFFKMVSDELNAGINGKITLETIDFTFFHHFPNFSVTLHNVHLQNDTYATYHKDVFYASRIFLDIELLPLLKKEVNIKALTINNANVFIFRTRSGYTNTDVFNSKQDSVRARGTNRKSNLLNLTKIGLRDVSITYADSLKNKFLSFQFVKTNHTVTLKDSIYTITSKGTMHVDSLMFNPTAGSYLRDKTLATNFLFKLNSRTAILSVEFSTIKLNTVPVFISGYFELKNEKRYFLKLLSPTAHPVETLPLLPIKLANSLARFNITMPVNVSVALKGKGNKNKPNIDVKFYIENASLKYKTLSFSNMTLKGAFTNHTASRRKKDNANSKLSIFYFVGNMQQVPITGHVTFTGLDDPAINIFVKTELNYSQVNNYINTDRLLLNSGTFETEIKYIGKLDEYLDSTRTTYEGKLKGSVIAKDVSVYYKPKKMFITKINTACTFTEKKLIFNTISLDLNGNTVKMNGYMINFIPFFIRPKNKCIIKLNIESNDLNLTPFAAKTKPSKKTKQESKQSQKKITDLFDKVYHVLEFDLTLDVKRLTFRTFEATALKGNVTLFNNTLTAKPITMNMAGGTTSLGFTLSKLFDPVSPMMIDLDVKNANIKSLFTTFNNFNQAAIQADNLSGDISADVKFNALVDDQYTILAPTMAGTLSCKIKNGALLDFEPIQNLSNFLFKKRDFSNVQFAELNSNFSIQGTNIDIKKMEIQSTVLSLFLQGRYSFTDSTSLSVQLPLSNLKKRHKDFKPENIGVDAKAGPSVFLHIFRDKDINTKMTIAYDPFKKWIKP